MKGWKLSPIPLESGSTARLYRAYNRKTKVYGHPYAMCDACALDQLTAPIFKSGECERECIVEELGWKCGGCPFKDGQ